MLNDMRSPNLENTEAVMASRSRQELIDFYGKHLSENPWRDGRWGKAFDKGSPLEYKNPVCDIEAEGCSAFGSGIFELPTEKAGLAMELRHSKYAGWHYNY